MFIIPIICHRKSKITIEFKDSDRDSTKITSKKIGKF